MDQAIDTFLSDPTPASLEAAKRAWLRARDDYGPGRHPSKPQVGEVVRRVHVQFRHPAVDKEPDGPEQAHEAEQDAEQRR